MQNLATKEQILFFVTTVTQKVQMAFRTGKRVQSVLSNPADGRCSHVNEAARSLFAFCNRGDK